MSLSKPPHVTVLASSPWEDDPFERETHGQRLLALIRTLRVQSYVIALNGDWGTGKSVFLRRLEHHLERAAPKIPVIRIDAWASDDAEDPLVPFVAALNTRLLAARGPGARTRMALVDAASKLAVPTTSFVANIVAPGSGSIIDAASKFGQALIDWESNRAAAATSFQKRLAEVRDLLTNRSKSEPIVTPIVIAIDELDRCKPDFSIRALERIKHFFNVPGVVFLIATDRGNLPAAVKSVYGDSVDGELYLRKFFDYEYRLPAPTPAAYIKALWKDFEMEQILPARSEDTLVEQAFSDENRYVEFLANHRDSLDGFEYKHYFSAFSTRFGLSLRDQSQAFTMLSAHIRTSPSTKVKIPLVDCFCVCYRFFDSDAFERFRRGAFSLSVAGNTATQKVSNALTSLMGSAEGMALNRYLSDPVASSASDSLRDMINTYRQHDRWTEVPAVARLWNRIRFGAKGASEYVEELLGLVHAFAPDATPRDGHSQ